MYDDQVRGAFTDSPFNRQKGRALRLFITCKADVRALNDGFEEPREFSVFTDEKLCERKKRDLKIDPLSSKVNTDSEGYITTYYGGAPLSIVPRDDNFGYELIFANTRKGALAARSFIGEMELLPLEGLRERENAA